MSVQPDTSHPDVCAICGRKGRHTRYKIPLDPQVLAIERTVLPSVDVMHDLPLRHTVEAVCPWCVSFAGLEKFERIAAAARGMEAALNECA